MMPLCESCAHRHATVEVIFTDGAAFVVCPGCEPASGVARVIDLRWGEVVA